MNYVLFCIICFSVSLILFMISMRKWGDHEAHPACVITLIMTILTAILPWFAQNWIYDFDEPICIEYRGKISTDYSWKHQEKTFKHNGETHKLNELLDYEKINYDSIPDSIMVFQYIYDDWLFVEPSKEFFVYSENPTKYTQEGACMQTVETK